VNKFNGCAKKLSKRNQRKMKTLFEAKDYIFQMCRPCVGFANSSLNKIVKRKKKTVR
jgi:hypothetical protein